MQNLDNVGTFIDDILIYSKTFRDHLRHLSAVLQRLKDHNLKLSIEKCNFGVNECQYLGYTLTSSGIIPGLDKTKAILDTPIPSTPKALKSYCGLVNFFRNFIGNFARKAAPLHLLARQHSGWKGGILPPEAKASFVLLQRELTTKPLLAFPNSDGRFHLYIDGAIGSDTAPGGLGAVLMQEQPDGKQRPVGFASRQLVKHEKNYSAFLIELTAAVFAIKFFEIYLRPRQFTLHSDHKPMTKLSTVHQKTLNRLEHLMLELNFDIQWLKGRDNVVADFLSRNTVPTAAAATVDSIDTSAANLARLQINDVIIMAARTAVMSGDQRPLAGHWKTLFPNLQLTNDVLVIKLPPRQGYLDKNTWRAICPSVIRKDVMAAAHSSIVGGHAGILKTTERIRSDFYWPGMVEDIKEYLENCNICQQYSNKYPATPGTPQAINLPSQPNEHVHVDLFGGLADQTSKNNYVLVVTCAFTKFVQLAAIPNKESDTVAKAILDTWIYRFGVMKNLISDQGNEFCNSLQEKLCDLLKINHRTTTPYFPKCNGQAEVFNKTMGHYLRTILAQEGKSKLDWRLYLAPLQFSYNTAVSRATKTSPFKALLNYPHRAPLWPDMDLLLEKDYNDVKKGSSRDFLYEWSETQQETRRTVRQNNQHSQEERTQPPATTTTTTTTNFQAGDLVWLWICAPKQPNPKLGPKWHEGVIVQRNSATTFHVRRTDISRRRKFVLNVQYIKARHQAEHDDPETAVNYLALLFASKNRYDTLERAIHQDRPSPERLLYWRRRLLRLHNPPMLVDIWNGIHQQQLRAAAARLRRQHPAPSPPHSDDEDGWWEDDYSNAQDDDDSDQTEEHDGAAGDDAAEDDDSFTTAKDTGPSSGSSDNFEWDRGEDEYYYDDSDMVFQPEGSFTDPAAPPDLRQHQPRGPTTSWEDDSTNESTSSAPDLDKIKRRADRLRRNMERVNYEEDHHLPSPRRSPRPKQAPPSAPVDYSPSAPADYSPSAPPLPPRPSTSHQPSQQKLHDRTGTVLRRLSEDLDEDHQRVLLSRKRLLRAVNRINNPDYKDNILQQCEDSWGKAPLATARLGTDASVQFHIQHLRKLLKDVVGSERVIPTLAERLRSDQQRSKKTTAVTKSTMSKK